MKCVCCQQELSQERLEALEFLGKLPQDYLCLDCAKQNDFKLKGIWADEPGGSLIIASGVYNDRTVFNDINQALAEKIKEEDEGID